MSPLRASLLLLTLVLGTGAQSGPNQSDVVQLLTAFEPAQLWARDARLSFPSTSSRLAARHLEKIDIPSDEADAAWMAIGASGARTHRKRMIANAMGSDLDRARVAILALGEMGAEGVEGLERVLSRGAPGLEETLILALARSGPEHGGKLVLEQASSRTKPLFEEAQSYERMARGGLPPPRGAVVELLELRWEAARLFGYVDERRWKDVLTAGLSNVESFVGRWISTAAAELKSPIADDYLLVWAVEGRTPARLVGAAQRVPVQLAELWELGRWIPDDEVERREIIDAIVQARNQVQARPLLERLVAVDPLNDRAQRALLAGDGEIEPLWIARQLEGEPSQQAAIAQVMGASSRDEWSKVLLELSEPVRATEVRAAALVARARRSDAQAEAELLAVLREPENATHAATVRALLVVGHDPRLTPMLAELGVGSALSEELRVLLLAARVERGLEVDAEPLRATLARSRSAFRREAAWALRRTDEQGDRQLLTSAFPVDDDMALNVELVLALTEYRDGTVRNLLRAVLWKRDFSLAMLAAGVLVQSYGMEALLDEVGQRDVGDEALRRLGLAIAEWADEDGLERLAALPSVRPAILEGVTLGSIARVARDR